MLKAKVIHCNPENAKLVLSFKAAVEGDSDIPPQPHFDCEVGKVKNYIVFFHVTSLILNGMETAPSLL